MVYGIGMKTQNYIAEDEVRINFSIKRGLLARIKAGPLAATGGRGVVPWLRTLAEREVARYENPGDGSREGEELKAAIRDQAIKAAR